MTVNYIIIVYTLSLHKLCRNSVDVKNSEHSEDADWLAGYQRKHLQNLVITSIIISGTAKTLKKDGTGLRLPNLQKKGACLLVWSVKLFAFREACIWHGVSARSV